MKTISVTGTASNAGKTTVASYILKNLSKQASGFVGENIQTASAKIGALMQHTEETSYGNDGREFDISNYERRLCALKITVRHEGSCPRHTGCNTCDSDCEPYKILAGDNIINEKGKDTDRLSRAGANKVVWLQTDSDAEKAGLEAALACFDKEDTIIVEGNSFLRVRDANVAILVASPSVKKIKRSAKVLLNEIDLIAINVYTSHTHEQIEECKERLFVHGYRAPAFVINPYLEDSFSNQSFIDKIQDILYLS